MLAPIAAQFEKGSYDEGRATLYVRFADPATASVFKHIERSGRYRIAGAEIPLICPLQQAEGVHGYVLSATVQSTKPDTAIATVRRTCLDPQRVVVTGENILLARNNGEWRIDKILNGFSLIPM